MTSDTGPADDAGPKPMLSDRQMRQLRFAVVGMGAILLVGFAVVIGRIVYLFNRAPTAPTVSTPGTPAIDIPLLIPKGASIRTMALEGRQLAVHFEGSGQAGILIIDLATGAVRQRIPVRHAE